MHKHRTQIAKQICRRSESRHLLNAVQNTHTLHYSAKWNLGPSADQNVPCRGCRKRIYRISEMAVTLDLGGFHFQNATQRCRWSKHKIQLEIAKLSASSNLNHQYSAKLNKPVSTPGSPKRLRQRGGSGLSTLRWTQSSNCRLQGG